MTPRTESAARYLEDPPIAKRILAIEDEIEALDGSIQGSVLWGSAALIGFGWVAVAFTVLGSSLSQYGFLLIGVTIGGPPASIFGFNVWRNRSHRRRLLRELDALIAQPTSTRSQPAGRT